MNKSTKKTTKVKCKYCSRTHTVDYMCYQKRGYFASGTAPKECSCLCHYDIVGYPKLKFVESCPHCTQTPECITENSDSVIKNKSMYHPDPQKETWQGLSKFQIDRLYTSLPFLKEGWEDRLKFILTSQTLKPNRLFLIKNLISKELKDQRQRTIEEIKNKANQIWQDDADVLSGRQAIRLFLNSLEKDNE